LDTKKEKETWVVKSLFSIFLPIWQGFRRGLSSVYETPKTLLQNHPYKNKIEAKDYSLAMFKSNTVIAVLAVSTAIYCMKEEYIRSLQGCEYLVKINNKTHKI